MRELMDEERTGVEKLVPVKLLPLITPGPCRVALCGQRVRRRSKAENVKNQGFVVTLPTILDESAFGFPTMRYRDSAVLGPLPICTAIDSVGKPANFALTFGITFEILRGRQCSDDQEGRIDC
jgi:hypothetical protein